MQLTKEQIQKINNFLEAINIEYLDIRFEMVDHIASEIEENIDNTTTFFEENRFQTPFLKYMLSKKETIIATYKKQVKKQFWVNNLAIIKDSFLQLKKPFVVAFITVIFSAGLHFVAIHKKHTYAFLLIVFLLNLFYMFYRTNEFSKKYGKIKIVQSYLSIQSFLSVVIIQIVNIMSLTFKEGQKTYEIYVFLTLFSIGFLVNQSFLNRKKAIKNKYNYLVD